MQVSGLGACGTYFFAIKSFDEAGNPSALSNVPMAQARVLPQAVTTLTVDAVSDDSVTLSWKAPQDDTATEAVSAYEIRYSTGTIDPANFDQATPVSQSLVPLAPGSNETLVVTPLAINTAYTFALVAIDECSGRSALSNVVSGEPGSQDTTPPAAIANLAAAPTLNVGEILLTWTAPADDGATGAPVTSYDVRVSEDAIDDGNFDSATQLPWSGAIVNPGAEQSFTISSGLLSGTLYYFAVKASDNRGLTASISNIVSATPN
jgi:hypothetical protein